MQIWQILPPQQVRMRFVLEHMLAESSQDLDNWKYTLSVNPSLRDENDSISECASPWGWLCSAPRILHSMSSAKVMVRMMDTPLFSEQCFMRGHKKFVLAKILYVTVHCTPRPFFVHFDNEGQMKSPKIASTPLGRFGLELLTWPWRLAHKPSTLRSSISRFRGTKMIQLARISKKRSLFSF